MPQAGYYQLSEHLRIQIPVYIRIIKKCAELFDSMDSYFEDERHGEEAKVLMSMMKDEWEQNWRDDSVYDYLGNREKETE